MSDSTPPEIQLPTQKDRRAKPYDPENVKEGRRRARIIPEIETNLQRYEKGFLTKSEYLALTANRVLDQDRQLSYLRQALEKAKGKILFDRTTGLPNEEYFQESYEEAVKKGEPFGLLLIDFDRFKNINDKYSHGIGDEALTHAGKTINEAMREDGTEGFTVFRLHGDEYAAIVRNVQDPEILKKIAERARTASEKTPLKTTFGGNAVTIPITFSIGGAIYKGEDPTEFRKRVDTQALINGAKLSRNTSVILT